MNRLEQIRRLALAIDPMSQVRFEHASGSKMWHADWEPTISDNPANELHYGDAKLKRVVRQMFRYLSTQAFGLAFAKPDRWQVHLFHVTLREVHRMPLRARRRVEAQRVSTNMLLAAVLRLVGALFPKPMFKLTGSSTGWGVEVVATDPEPRSVRLPFGTYLSLKTLLSNLGAELVNTAESLLEQDKAARPPDQEPNAFISGLREALDDVEHLRVRNPSQADR